MWGCCLSSFTSLLSLLFLSSLCVVVVVVVVVVAFVGAGVGHSQRLLILGGVGIMCSCCRLRADLTGILMCKLLVTESVCRVFKYCRIP